MAFWRVTIYSERAARDLECSGVLRFQRALALRKSSITDQAQFERQLKMARTFVSPLVSLAYFKCRLQFAPPIGHEALSRITMVALARSRDGS
jgi:hypothetical protein